MDNHPAIIRSPDEFKPALIKNRGDDVDFHLSFAPSDCHAFVMLPVFDGNRIITRITERMGEVVMFSLSSHRDKFPVSRLGRMLPIGFTAGRRTVAGTIGLVLWDRNALRRLSDRLYKTFPQFIGTPKPDEFPPLDILLVFVNEVGVTVSVTLYGVTFLDEGTTLNTEDARAFTTLSYMAVDYEINTDPLSPKRDDAIPVPQEEPVKTKQNEQLEVNRYRLSPNGQRPSDLPLQLTRPSLKFDPAPNTFYNTDVRGNIFRMVIDRNFLPAGNLFGKVINRKPVEELSLR